jgi:hypothetical protein
MKYEKEMEFKCGKKEKSNPLAVKDLLTTRDQITSCQKKSIHKLLMKGMFIQKD